MTGPGVSSPATHAALAALEQRASAGGPDPGADHRHLGGGRPGLLVNVPLAGDGTSGVSDDALLTLRGQVLPQTLGQVSGVSYAVTGNTATTYDWGTTLRSHTPVVFAVVAGLAFLVLMIAFRSLWLPLASIVLNLLSVGAAYGVITLIFQDGFLHGLFGATPGEGIAQWVPLFMFVLRSG